MPKQQNEKESFLIGDTFWLVDKSKVNFLHHLCGGRKDGCSTASLRVIPTRADEVIEKRPIAGILHGAILKDGKFSVILTLKSAIKYYDSDMKEV